jgi:hypothetical protein
MQGRKYQGSGNKYQEQVPNRCASARRKGPNPRRPISKKKGTTHCKPRVQFFDLSKKNASLQDFGFLTVKLVFRDYAIIQ